MPQGVEDKHIHEEDIPQTTALPVGPESDVSSPSGSRDGDFDDWAAEFWSVYADEAQRYDEAVIGTWKEDMEAVIIFVRYPSPTLSTHSSCAVRVSP
jgi:Family of unknown function (DUF6535)